MKWAANIEGICSMKIYTKTGDHGETSLFGNRRVQKSDCLVAVYGASDEVNASIGALRSDIAEALAQHPFLTATIEFLSSVQSQIFTMGSWLATPLPARVQAKLPPFQEEWIAHLETAIDHMDRDLPPLKNFILPGGPRMAATAHVARTVCRRFERELVAWQKDHGEDIDFVFVAYTNRLSDYLFVLARWLTVKLGQHDQIWKP